MTKNCVCIYIRTCRDDENLLAFLKEDIGMQVLCFEALRGFPSKSLQFKVQWFIPFLQMTIYLLGLILSR